MSKNSSEVFKKPVTLFQDKLNDIMKDEPTKDMILDLIELQLYKNAEKDDKKLVYVELYNLLGVEKFMEVMDILSGKTIKFPEKDDFKETIQIALSYYYKYYMGYSWDEIKTRIGDEEMSSVKFGIKCQKLQRFIWYVRDKVIARLHKNGK